MDRLNMMEIFTRIVDTNSFTKAADSLQLASPAISRAVKELEGRLGVRLINRTTRRLSLTEEGRSYYEAAVKILHAVDESEATFQLDNTIPTGTLKVDVQTSIAHGLIVPRLAEFRDLHPNIKLILGTGDRTVDLCEDPDDSESRFPVRSGAAEL